PGGPAGGVRAGVARRQCREAAGAAQRDLSRTLITRDRRTVEMATNEAPVERRLAAILAADVVGYSRLMGADEVGTLRALQACRRELIDPAIAGRRGRIFKTTGDGLLVEFPSAVDAVACAIAAAPAPEVAPAVAPRRRAWPWLGAGAAAILLIAAGAAWWALREPAAAPQPVAAAVSPPAPIPATRASIAVLPFTQLGGESSGDYFADGLTEDIIAALGRFRELSVIARAAVFTYKGKNPTPAEVGRDLKVRYVLEGSVRRSPERVRVSTSLTDTSRSAVLWSEKYDAELKDIFEVQDQITRQISGALAVRVTSLE